MRRLLVGPLVATAVGLGACGGSAAQPAGTATGPSANVPADAPQLVTARHHGGTFRLAPGRELELRLGPRARVAARGRSVRLTQIDFVADPGYTAWALTAVTAGPTVLAGRSGGQRFRVTLVVRG